MDKWTESGLQIDRQTGFQENSGQPGGQVGMRTGGWQQGCCLPPAPTSEAELATRLDFQFSARLGPGKTPGSRASVGSFSCQRGVSGCR